MLASLRQLNARWTAEGRMEFHIGIGLNHGEVIAGNMGSPRRKEFTVIGDAVNLASRLEGVTKEYDLQLVIGESVAALVRDDFPLQTVDLLQVKGKNKPVDTFTVPFPAPDPALLATYEEAVREYRAGRFFFAQKQFDALCETWTANDLPALYSNRCRHLIKEPPQDWTGIWIMKTKSPPKSPFTSQSPSSSYRHTHTPRPWVFHFVQDDEKQRHPSSPHPERSEGPTDNSLPTFPFS